MKFQIHVKRYGCQWKWECWVYYYTKAQGLTWTRAQAFRMARLNRRELKKIFVD